MCLNFGLARDLNGLCNLRFDDSNPEKATAEYTEAIKKDVAWLGFEWREICYASDYFKQLHDYAVELIKLGKAYVCELSPDEIRAARGTLTEPGQNSPYRERDMAENLRLFEQMRDGRHAEGAYVLRAKIEMSSPNINMRDPVIYRIRHASHHRTGDSWCIYPTYDFTHCLSDAIEGVTHSLCTLEFEDHRPLYDWILEQLNTHRPQQIEFARLQLNYTITSKRNLKKLVDEHVVDGWDDPRMPTLSGLRRRGIPAAAIREFCERIGVTKKDSWIEMESLETCGRDYLNPRAPRAFAVLRPLEVVIENYPQDRLETLTVPNHPNDPSMGTRQLPFSRTLYIERDDFMEEAPKKFFRLAPGREVRLRYAYCITCRKVETDEHGRVVRLLCTYDPHTGAGKTPDGRKVKGIIHWLSAPHSGVAEMRLYDRLFSVERPCADELLSQLNPQSLITLRECRIEPSLRDAPPGRSWQFERLGYFCVDLNSAGAVFNRIMTLRDTWSKVARRN